MKIKLKNYIEFISENNSAFDDIQYTHDAGFPMYSTDDQVTIDFSYMSAPFFEDRDAEKVGERLEKFNKHYGTNIDLNSFLNTLPIIEEFWEGEDLTIKQIVFMCENPDKIEDLYTSMNAMQKYNL